MLKIATILMIYLFIINVHVKGQNTSKVPEQIALEEFLRVRGENGYDHIKYFIFDGRISKDYSYGNSFCILIPYVENFRGDTINKITLPNREDLIKKIGFLKRIFIKNDNVREIKIYRKYPMEKNYVVVIKIYNKIYNDYFSFVIDPKLSSVIDMCNHLHYE
jgi:hypothetical protein